MNRNIRLDDEREHQRKAREKEERRLEYERKWAKKSEEGYNSPYFSSLRRSIADATVIETVRDPTGAVLYRTVDDEVFLNRYSAERHTKMLAAEALDAALIRGKGITSIGAWVALGDSRYERVIYAPDLEILQGRDTSVGNGVSWIKEIIVRDEPEYVERTTVDGRIERVRVR